MGEFVLDGCEKVAEPLTKCPEDDKRRLYGLFSLEDVCTWQKAQHRSQTKFERPPADEKDPLAERNKVEAQQEVQPQIQQEVQPQIQQEGAQVQDMPPELD